MGNKNSNIINNKNEIQEEVDTSHAAGIPESASDKLYDSIVRIELDNNRGTGFFMKANIKGKQYKFLLTNFHVIKEEYVSSKKEFNIFLEKNMMKRRGRLLWISIKD